MTPLLICGICGAKVVRAGRLKHLRTHAPEQSNPKPRWPKSTLDSIFREPVKVLVVRDFTGRCRGVFSLKNRRIASRMAKELRGSYESVLFDSV